MASRDAVNQFRQFRQLRYLVDYWSNNSAARNSKGEAYADGVTFGLKTAIEVVRTLFHDEEASQGISKTPGVGGEVACILENENA